MAEAERFELSRALRPLPVFKTGPFSHLGKLPTKENFSILTIFPKRRKPDQYALVDPAGFEPATNRL